MFPVVSSSVFIGVFIIISVAVSASSFTIYLSVVNRFLSSSISFILINNLSFILPSTNLDITLSKNSSSKSPSFINLAINF